MCFSSKKLQSYFRSVLKHADKNSCKQRGRYQSSNYSFFFSYAGKRRGTGAGKTAQVPAQRLKMPECAWTRRHTLSASREYRTERLVPPVRMKSMYSTYQIPRQVKMEEE